MGIPEKIYYMLLSFLSIIERIFGRYIDFRPKKDIILCYHSVGDDAWRFSTPPSAFRNQLEVMQKYFSISSVENILSVESSRPRVAITFDDGYQNLFENVKPCSDEVHIPVCVFLIGNPEKRDKLEMKNSLPLLTENEIRQLSSAGWEIGYHTASHADLRSSNTSTIEYEIRESKNYFERKYNLSVKYFAYPRGIITESIHNVVKKSGYDAAFSVDGGYVDQRDRFRIPRIPIEGDIDLAHFKAQISAPGIILSQWYMSVLQWKEMMQYKISAILRNHE